MLFLFWFAIDPVRVENFFCTVNLIIPPAFWIGILASGLVFTGGKASLLIGYYYHISDTAD